MYQTVILVCLIIVSVLAIGICSVCADVKNAQRKR